MKVIRIVEVLLLLVAAVALTYVYFAFREHFPWLLAGVGIGATAGVLVTVLISRAWRKGSEPSPK
jgi:membrane protein YdbS with pleckstrin-like domain